MSAKLRMVHLRTVPDAWQARVLAARLGCEGIVTQLRGNLSGPYPFGAVSVLVEEEQAQLASDLLLADEVESAFYWPGAGPGERTGSLARDHVDEDLDGVDEDLDDVDVRWLPDGDELLDGPEDIRPGVRVRPRWFRALAALAAVLVAGAPLLAHFAG